MSGRLRFQIVIAASFAACSTGSGRDEVFRSYVDAVNRNAVSAALALHTADAEFIIPGQTPIRGLEAMRSLLQWDSVLTSQLRFDKGAWRGDTLVISGGSERNAWFAGIGMDSLAYGPGLQVVFSGAVAHFLLRLRMVQA